MESGRKQIEALDASIASDQPHVTRGQRAQSLLENDLLVEAVEAVRQDCLGVFEKLSTDPTGAHKPEEYDRVALKLRCLEEVMSQVKHHVNTGKLAAARIEADQSKRRGLLAALGLQRVA